MPDTSPTTGTRSTVIMCVTVFFLVGCESTKNWMLGRRTADAEPITIGESDTGNYLQELAELAGGDPATQAEIFADAESRATLTPDPSTELRFALILATPGHAGADPVQAQSMLREALARTELLTPTEVSLATIHLKDVEARIVLDAEARRLRSQYSRAASTEEAAVARRIATIEAENRQLRESLAEAESKLEAITSIERSIRQQAENDEPQ